MSKRLNRFTLLFVAAFVLVAGCGPRPVPAEATPLGLPPDVAEAAKQELSNAIDVPVAEIDTVRAWVPTPSV
jgi:hypothetical protein